MKKQLKINACSQKWEELTRTEQGRLCQQCDKIITDFRKMDGEQIVQTHKISRTQICGVYTKGQLEDAGPPNSKWQISTRAAVVAGAFGLLASESIYAQQPKQVAPVMNVEDGRDGAVRYVTVPRSNTVESRVEEVQPDTLRSCIIIGKITSEYGEALPYVSIWIKDAKIGTLSDIDGNYKLDISAVLDTSETVLMQYSTLGYSSQEVLFTKPMLQAITKYDVQFKEVLLNVMGVVIVSRRQQYSPRRLWWRLKHAFR